MGTFQVEHIDNSDVVTDISTFVHSIDYVRFFSDGRINTASITLQAQAGQFMNNSSGGATPIINNFDRIRITGTDADGNSYSHIFEVINDLAQLNQASEYLLPLTLEGRERALALIPFSGYFDPPLDHHAMLERIIATYFSSFNPSLQPLIETRDDFGFEENRLPKYNPNIWDFLYIDNCLDALKVVIRLANQSVAAGGTGDRWSLIFKDDDTFPLSRLNLGVNFQGRTNIGSTLPIIRANEITNPIKIIGKTKQPLTGTVVIARGRPGSGGVPVQGDQYRSRLEFYQRIRARQSWSATIFYDIDAFTSFANQVYQANTANTNDQPPSANWTTVSAGQFIGDIQYSPFTIDKAALYRNECTNPQLAFSSQIEASPKMLDCNIVINDVETQRDWVYIRQITDVFTTWSTNERRYLHRGNDTGEALYEGFRILVDSSLGTPAGAFSGSADNFGTGNGNDPNGKPYLDNQAVFAKDSNGILKWYVLKEHDDFDQTLVRFEGLFEFNVAFVAKSKFPASDTNNANRRFRQSGSGSPNAWRSLNEQFLSNDCLHSPSSITNRTGLIDPVLKDGGGTYTDQSTVRIIYEYTNKADLPEWRKTLDIILGVAVSATGFLGTFAIGAAVALYDLFLTPYYRNAGWWITWSFPFPVSDFNAIQEQVGELYGGGDVIPVDNLNGHSTFDAFNLNATFTGQNSWTTDNATDMMEITGVTFLYRLDIQVNGTTMPFTGDIPCSFWAMDDNGTLWKNKKKYRHLNDIQRMTFEFGDFSPVYRARTPFGINSIVTNILSPELEIRERLFPNRIRMMGFMMEGSYDDKGRYMPTLWESVIKPTIITMFDPTTVSSNVQFIGDIDYFQWVKTPIAISSNQTFGRVVFPEIKDYPNITNIEQLQRAADADLDVEIFQYEQYGISRNNKADIQLQDSVFLFEEFMIKEAEAPIPTGVASFSSGTTYTIDDLVTSVSIIYISLQKPNLGNTPASSPLFWLAMTDPVANTRLLTVGEIQFSVTNGKDIEFQHTLIRRIPRV